MDFDDTDHGDDVENWLGEDEDATPAKPYECLSRADIITQQTNAISRVADVLSLPFSTARILLQYCMVCVGSICCLS